MLVVIGPNWLDMRDPGTGGRRLDQPDDWVRLEIGAALARGIGVIPVLVGGARFPARHTLPNDLQELADRHHVILTTNGFRYEMAGLAKDIGELVKPTANRSWKQRIMPIAFRLSIVAGIVAALAGAGDFYLRRHRIAQEIMSNSIRIDRALECANSHSDDVINKYRNIYGNFDISKLHCADKTFWASMADIRDAKSREERRGKYSDQYWDEFFRYHSWYDGLSVGLVSGIMGSIAVNLLGLVLVVLCSVLSWVAGRRRSA